MEMTDLGEQPHPEDDEVREEETNLIDDNKLNESIPEWIHPL